MPFTEEEIANMFTDTALVEAQEEKCPEGFEKDNVTGECIPTDLKISPDFDPQEGLQDMVNLTDTLKKGPDAVESIEIQDVEKPLVPDINFSVATDWGLDFIKTTFDRQYKEGYITSDIGYANNLLNTELKDYTPEVLQEFFGLEILTDENNKEIENIAKTKGLAVFNSLMKNNPTITDKLIPATFEKISPLLEAEKLRLQKQYTGENAAKAIEEYGVFFNKTLNNELNKNPVFKQILEANLSLAEKTIAESISKLGKEALDIEDIGDLETGVRRMSRYLKEYALMTKGSISAGKFRAYNDQVEKDLSNAEKYGWTDDTVVYLRKGKDQGNQIDGDVIPEVLEGKKQRIPGEQNAYIKTTWKEAREYQKSLADPQMQKGVSEISEAQRIKDATTYFDKADLTDGITFKDFTIGLGEFLPQIPLGILTAGSGIILQETAGNYVDNLYAIAKQDGYGDNPTGDELFKIIEEKRDRKGLAFSTGIPQGAMELFGLKKLTKLSKELIKSVPKGALIRGGMNNFKNVLNGLAGSKVRKQLAYSAFYEGLTETGQTLGSQTSQTIASGGESYYNFDEILNAAGMGFALGGFLPFAGGAARQSLTEFKNTASIIAGKFNPNHVENIFNMQQSQVEKDFNEGLISPEERRERLIALGEVRAAGAQLPKFQIFNPITNAFSKMLGRDASLTGNIGENLSPEDRTEAIKLLIEQQRLKNSKKNINPDLVDPKINERLKEIQQRLQNIVIKDEINLAKEKGKSMTAKEDLKITKKFAEILGVEVNDKLANDPVAFQKFLDENKIEFNIETDSGFVGPDGNTLYINLPTIKKNGVNFKTASHELLHVMLYEEIQKNPTKFQADVDSLIDSLSPAQKETLNLLMQPYLEQTIEIEENGKKVQAPYLEVRPDEFITQMWEGGLFEKDPSLLQKFIDFIKNIFGNVFGSKVDVNIDNPNDLKSFFNAYKESYNTGKLSQFIINKNNQRTGVKPSSIAKSSDQTAFQAMDQIVPLGTTKDQYLKLNINEAFNATMPGNVISNYISSKSTSPQQFNENIATIRDRLANFNPDAKRKNDKNSTPIQFSEFVVANTNFSKLVANKKLAIEADKKAQEDRIDDGTLQIANPKSTSSSKPEIDKRIIYPDAVLPKANEFSNKFLTDTKFNLSTLSTEELSNLTYKTSKIIAPQAFADIWGLPLKVITQKNFNLSDIKNIRRVQSWIRTNAITLIKLLPEGNTDVKISDSKIKNKDGTFRKIKRGGESLALPDNIRDNPVFYTQLFKPDGTPVKIDSETLNAKGKSKSKSNQYRKRPDITRTQFLKAFGVTDNKSDKQFDVRESEAQSIKGLLEIVGRNITNYYAEQDLDTRPDISASKKAISKVKMRSGASKLAFSSEYLKDFTNDFQLMNGVSPKDVIPMYVNTGKEDYSKYKYGTKDRDAYAADLIKYGGEYIGNLFQEDLGGRASFFNSSNFAAGSKNRLGSTYFYSNERKQIIKEIKERQKQRKKEGKFVKEWTTEEKEKIKVALSNKDSYFDTRKKGWFENKTKNYEGGLLILKMFSDIVNENPEAINMVTAFFNSAVSSTGHFWRQLSFPRMLDNDYLNFVRLKNKAKRDFENNVISEEKYEELTNRTNGKYAVIKEHMWQQNAALDFILPAMFDGTLEENYKFLELNYYQAGISLTNDNKLKDTEGKYGPKYNYGEKEVAPFKEGLIKAILSGNPNDAIESVIRYLMAEVSNNNGGFNLNTLTFDNKSIAEIYNLQLNSNQINKQSIVNQQLLARLVVEKAITKEKARQLLLNGIPLTPEIAQTSVINNNKLKSTPIPFSKDIVFTNKNVLDRMAYLDDQANKARVTFSKDQDLNKEFNEIIEKATGIGKEKRYGQTKARAVGADKGRFDLFGIPPSAQDFVGLTRYFAGKGKQGDATIAWVKKNFLDPFARGNIDISNARVALNNDFKTLKKLLNISPKNLSKKITGEPYTVGNAVRVYTWVKQGMTIPGLSKADQKLLVDFVENDANLIVFSEQLIAINKENGYPKPQSGWLAGTISTDLLASLNNVVRAKYLKQWQTNVDNVFTEENMNKLEAAFGTGYREALQDILGRMKTGSNRGFKGDTLTGRFIDWINGSVGAIMFFNSRSAVLQTISAVNFINWSDNNILEAAKAFGNQKQYWKDVMELMNSDYLIERRNGLKINVAEADIAEIAAESKNKAKAFISKILKLGFLPTQIADSFAIASGGATFYRNRLKSLLKTGMSQKEAEAQAFLDFREIAEENQQSSRPDRISKQQAGPMGRIILAFANTPAQYARIMQKAASDLKNRRGDDKTNISKIIYYGAIQNVIFNALQQALFAIGFGDDEPDEEKLNKKYTGIVNGMADSLLRGLGFHGAAVSTLKNTIIKLAEGAEAQDAAIELLDFSPPVSSKIGKLRSAGRTWDWNKKEIKEKGWSLDNPAWLAIGQVISASTNLPLDRGIRKLQNLKDASDSENAEWMRIANVLGWQKWELDWAKDKPKKRKTRKKSSKKRKTF
jgi:hypothetical protein